MRVTHRGIVICLIAAIALLPALSGCIGPQEVAQRVLDRLEQEDEYRWNEKLDGSEEFKVIDTINEQVAKVETYPLRPLKRDALFLHLYVDVNFSNVINKDWECLTTGYANITITRPSGENITCDYHVLGKDNTYNEFFYFPHPAVGNWSLTVKVRGSGHYRMFAEAYEPV
jgi:hypothetical protein